MKIITIVGARPQFIKAAAVSRAINRYNQKNENVLVTEIMVHTGQHYDNNLSQIFFDELKIPKPDYNLEVGSGSHGQMTAAMLSKIERVLVDEKPDQVLVYGDTNSTMAGALAAAKLHIPVAHVEAGLRSFNRRMPEEINRAVTDHLSALLFCPTDTAVKNLQQEGIVAGVFNVGDVMYDSFLFNKNLAEKKSKVLQTLDLKIGQYALTTVHREENTDDPAKLSGIFEAFNQLARPDFPFIVCLHPRTQKALKKLKKYPLSNPHLRMIKPVSYLDMIMLETQAKIILTDSGGVQKEAYFAKTPCVTLRDETEWVELVEQGANTVAGCVPENIYKAYKELIAHEVNGGKPLYGDGRAGHKIVDLLVNT